MKKIFLGLLLLVSISNVAVADSRAVIGMGAISCEKYNVSLNESNRGLAHATQSWVLGFLTALNMDSPKDFLKGTGSNAIVGELNQYCQNNPLNEVGDGAYTIFLQLRKKVR